MARWVGWRRLGCLGVGLAMTRHGIARAALGAGVGTLAILAGLIINPSAHVAEADTNVGW